MRKREIQEKTCRIASELSGAIWALEANPLEDNGRQDVMLRWLRHWRSELIEMSSKRDRLIQESIVAEAEDNTVSPGSRLLRLLEH